MKTITLILIGIALTLFGTSCGDQREDQSVLVIKNSTSQAFVLMLYPKAQYKYGATLYHNSDFGGSYSDMTLEIGSNETKAIFIADLPDLQPQTLVSNVFDSIQIRPVHQIQATIRFSPESVVGYPLNIFKDSSAWKYADQRIVLNMSLSRRIVDSHEHTLDIQSLLF